LDVWTADYIALGHRKTFLSTILLTGCWIEEIDFMAKIN